MAIDACTPHILGASCWLTEAAPRNHSRFKSCGKKTVHHHLPAVTVKVSFWNAGLGWWMPHGDESLNSTGRQSSPFITSHLAFISRHHIPGVLFITFQGYSLYYSCATSAYLKKNYDNLKKATKTQWQWQWQWQEVPTPQHPQHIPQAIPTPITNHDSYRQKQEDTTELFSSWNWRTLQKTFDGDPFEPQVDSKGLMSRPESNFN